MIKLIMKRMQLIPLLNGKNQLHQRMRKSLHQNLQNPRPLQQNLKRMNLKMVMIRNQLRSLPRNRRRKLKNRKKKSPKKTKKPNQKTTMMMKKSRI